MPRFCRGRVGLYFDLAWDQKLSLPKEFRLNRVLSWNSAETSTLCTGAIGLVTRFCFFIPNVSLSAFFFTSGIGLAMIAPLSVPGNGRCKGNRQISASVFKGSRRPVKDFSDSRGQGLEREWFNEYRLNRLRNVFAEGFIVRVTGHVENS
jgi:hypothetical protein